jgi:hypothetical protein
MVVKEFMYQRGKKNCDFLEDFWRLFMNGLAEFLSRFDSVTIQKMSSP